MIIHAYGFNKIGDTNTSIQIWNQIDINESRASYIKWEYVFPTLRFSTNRRNFKNIEDKHKYIQDKKQSPIK